MKILVYYVSTIALLTKLCFSIHVDKDAVQNSLTNLDEGGGGSSVDMDELIRRMDQMDSEIAALQSRNTELETRAEEIDKEKQEEIDAKKSLEEILHSNIDLAKDSFKDFSEAFDDIDANGDGLINLREINDYRLTFGFEDGEDFDNYNQCLLNVMDSEKTGGN